MFGAGYKPSTISKFHLQRSLAATKGISLSEAQELVSGNAITVASTFGSYDLGGDKSIVYKNGDLVFRDNSVPGAQPGTDEGFAIGRYIYNSDLGGYYLDAAVVVGYSDKTLMTSGQLGKLFKGLNGSHGIENVGGTSGTKGGENHWQPTINFINDIADGNFGNVIQAMSYGGSMDMLGMAGMGIIGKVGNITNFKAVNASYLKQIGIHDIHAFKAEWLGTNANLKFFDVVKNTQTGELMIIRKTTQEVIVNTNIFGK